MPAGIEIWDEAGNILVDANTGMLFLGMMTLSTSQSTGSITVPEFGIAGAEPWTHYVNNAFAGLRALTITVSGTTLSWSPSGQIDNPDTDKYGYLMWGLR